MSLCQSHFVTLPKSLSHFAKVTLSLCQSHCVTLPNSLCHLSKVTLTSNPQGNLTTSVRTMCITSAVSIKHAHFGSLLCASPAPRPGGINNGSKGVQVRLLKRERRCINLNYAAIYCSVRSTEVSARKTLSADASGHSRAFGVFMIQRRDLRFLPENTPKLGSDHWHLRLKFFAQ